MATRPDIIAAIASTLDAISNTTQLVAGGKIADRLNYRMSHPAAGPDPGGVEQQFPNHLTDPTQAAGYLAGNQVALGAAISEVFEDNTWRTAFLGALADGILKNGAQVFNVLDYVPSGYVAGITDATSAVQAALTACTRGVVLFPPGDYNIKTGRLTPNSNTIIVGQNARIFCSTTLGNLTPFFYLTGSLSNIEIRGLEIDGGGSWSGSLFTDPYNGAQQAIGFNNDGYGIYIDTAVTDVVVRDCTLHGIGRALNNLGTRVRIFDNHIYNCGWHGVRVDTATDCIVTNNDIHGIYGNYYSPATNVTDTQFSKYADGIYVQKTQGAVIADNIINDFIRIGIVLEGDTVTLNRAIAISNNVIYNGHDSKGTEFNVGIWSEATHSDDTISIVGGTIHDMTHEGIEAWKTNIKGVTIYNCGTHGISGSEFTAEGNEIYHCKHGIQVYAQSAGKTTKINGNHIFWNDYDGILVELSHGIIDLRGNTIKDNGLDGQAASNKAGVTIDRYYSDQTVIINGNTFISSRNETPGTAAGYLINNVGGYVAGTKTVTVGTGAGTMLVGDNLAFAGVSGFYVVTSALAAGSVSFEPGLRSAVANGATVTLQSQVVSGVTGSGQNFGIRGIYTTPVLTSAYVSANTFRYLGTTSAYPTCLNVVPCSWGNDNTATLTPKEITDGNFNGKIPQPEINDAGLSGWARFMGYATAAPVSGAYAAGDYFLFDNVTTSYYRGCICVVAGSPGTWENFGLVTQGGGATLTVPSTNFAVLGLSKMTGNILINGAVDEAGTRVNAKDGNIAATGGYGFYSFGVGVPSGGAYEALHAYHNGTNAIVEVVHVGGSYRALLIKNNGATAATLGTDGTLTLAFALMRSNQTGITAATTQAQGNGPLTADINIVSTVANLNDTVTLPSAVAGMSVYIRNNGAQTLQIFPASGGAINGGAVNASVTLAAGASVTYHTADATNWYS